LEEGVPHSSPKSIMAYDYGINGRHHGKARV
jgi:hypothetical protein